MCRQNTNLPLEVLLHRLNPVLRGWTAYFRPGVSSAAFSYLRAFTWRQVVGWLRRKHPRIELEGTPPPLLQRRMVARRRRSGPVQPRRGARPPATATGARKIPTPWPSTA